MLTKPILGQARISQSTPPFSMFSVLSQNPDVGHHLPCALSPLCSIYIWFHKDTHDHRQFDCELKLSVSVGS